MLNFNVYYVCVCGVCVYGCSEKIQRKDDIVRMLILYEIAKITFCSEHYGWNAFFEYRYKKHSLTGNGNNVIYKNDELC